jgi:hypothetical protein
MRSVMEPIWERILRLAAGNGLMYLKRTFGHDD